MTVTVTALRAPLSAGSLLLCSTVACVSLTDRFVVVVQLLACEYAPLDDDARVQAEDALLQLSDGGLRAHVHGQRALYRTAEQLHVDQHGRSEEWSASGQQGDTTWRRKRQNKQTSTRACTPRRPPVSQSLARVTVAASLCTAPKLALSDSYQASIQWIGQCVPVSGHCDAAAAPAAEIVFSSAALLTRPLSLSWSRAALMCCSPPTSFALPCSFDRPHLLLSKPLCHRVRCHKMKSQRRNFLRARDRSHRNNEQHKIKHE